ncbi:hypothetical protein D3C87_1413000 [compost metagenome]
MNFVNTSDVLFKSSLPVLSSTRNSNPAELPNPGTVGGGKNSISASMICAVAFFKVLITSETDSFRLSQATRLIIPIP